MQSSEAEEKTTYSFSEGCIERKVSRFPEELLAKITIITLTGVIGKDNHYYVEWSSNSYLNFENASNTTESNLKN